MLTIIAKAQGSDTRWVFMKLTEPLLVEPIPDIHEAVTASGGKRAEFLVETKQTGFP